MNFLKIEECESNNGYGFGTTLYLSGCPRRCRGCFNQAGWKRKAGTEFTEENYAYLEHCLERGYIQRLSFSGGDPLAPWNREGVLEICARVKERYGKKIITWIYTGYQLLEFKNGSEGFQQCRGLTAYDGAPELETMFLQPETDLKTDFETQGGGRFHIRDFSRENGFFHYLSLYTDFLVDGEYKQEETHTEPFRGSDNQILWACKNGRWWIVQ